jgi:hypothetical protein
MQLEAISIQIFIPYPRDSFLVYLYYACTTIVKKFVDGGFASTYYKILT